MKSTTVALLTNETGAHLSHYFTALADIKEVREVIVADTSGTQIKQARQALGNKLAASYASAEKLFEQTKPALALVSVEGASAPGLIDIALNNGCQVFAEKPACTQAAQFEKLAQKADSKHLTLMLALANRLNPEIQAAHQLMKKNRLGDIYGVELNLLADQTRLQNKNYHQQWYASKKRAGGGFLIWLAIHWLDLSMYLTGSRISEVSGMITNIGGQPIDVEDSAVLTCKYENGFLGSLTSGYYLKSGYQSAIKIWGSKGWLSSEPFANRHLEYVIYGENQGQVQKFTGNPQPRGYTPMVRSWVRSVLGLEPVPLTTKESLQVIRTIYTAYEAAESGRTQKVTLS